MTTDPRPEMLGRRTLLAGSGAGALALASGGSARAVAPTAPHGRLGRYPGPWPTLEPYGTADTRPELWPRDDNSFVLPLELRPRDEELGRVWMRDTYVNHVVVRGRSVYVCTGTSRVPGLDRAAPWNDGIFVWTAPSLRGPWSLADTTGIRPGAERGKVWSPEFVDENTADRVVVAPWQEYWEDERFGKRGQVWAPEIHRFQDTWFIVACMGDHAQKVGSFLLRSEGGIEGPYRLAEGNHDKPFGEPFVGGPAFVEPGAYHHIDGSMFSERGSAWLVLHNHLYARFRDDMEDIVPQTDLPTFDEVPYDPEPYIEGAYVFEKAGAYYLVGAVWDRTWTVDGEQVYRYDNPGPGRTQYQYDMVLAVADRFEGPYSPRWTAGVGAGHNNLFEDRRGTVWATFFRNPNAGYWSDPSRIDDAAVPGVVRMEWTGPRSDRLYVARPRRRRS
ncbi:family 43 glycosylhydrolase [Phycicoccus sp. CSK15P-2]|uniref:family 43 glycosylhydrolase n=1 Tax=Phycicoccus sp. CSK15P-2 TaxID=2807627 RepID=UPI00194FD80B|nr:family 43 glycosylhydrolase [Phycicoccus sp. CSK15P-2]MBM6404480.1 family 43 glycosylhydrolase [Phycicoccus sp. CSK15P-2]